VAGGGEVRFWGGLARSVVVTGNSAGRRHEHKFPKFTFTAKFILNAYFCYNQAMIFVKQAL